MSVDYVVITGHLPGTTVGPQLVGWATRASNDPIYYGLAAGPVAQVVTSLATLSTVPAVLERWGHLLAGAVAETAGAAVPMAGVSPAAL